jgi:hypothetical protein
MSACNCMGPPGNCMCMRRASSNKQEIFMSNPLHELKETFGKGIYGLSPTDCKEKGICISCKEPAIPRCHTEAGRREFYISALCEECWDKIFE